MSHRLAEPIERLDNLLRNVEDAVEGITALARVVKARDQISRLRLVREAVKQAREHVDEVRSELEPEDDTNTAGAHRR